MPGNLNRLSNGADSRRDEVAMPTESKLRKFRGRTSVPGSPTVKPSIIVAVLAIGFATGCEAVFSGEGGGEVMATIDFSRGYPSPDTAAVRAPDTVGVRQSFPVTMRTYSGCLLEEGRTKSEVNGLSAEVTPFMRTVPGVNCPDFLRVTDRIAYLRFTSRGVGTVTVFGLNDITYPSFGSTRRADTIHVKRTVVVR